MRTLSRIDKQQAYISVSKMAEEDVFLAATSNALWDPVHSKDWDKEKVTPQCVLRIKR